MADQPSIVGPLARIDRANELLTHLDTALKGFIETRPYVVEELPDPNATTRAFVLRKLHDVPERPRIIAGEVAHHLRSALDLLAYQLLIKEGIKDWKRLRECAFPIITNRDLSNTDDRKKHDASINAKVGGVSKQAHDRIVALQPCATNGEWSHLAQVQELDNTDKHRLLLAAAASMDLKNFAHHDEAGNVTVYPQVFVPLQEDQLVKVGPVPSVFRLPNLAHVVAFMEPGPVFGKPVVHILQNLSRMTRETIESFEDCF
jgi:hypothetical protein